MRKECKNEWFIICYLIANKNEKNWETFDEVRNQIIENGFDFEQSTIKRFIDHFILAFGPNESMCNEDEIKQNIDMMKLNTPYWSRNNFIYDIASFHRVYLSSLVRHLMRIFQYF